MLMVKVKVFKCLCCHEEFRYITNGNGKRIYCDNCRRLKKREDRKRWKSTPVGILSTQRHRKRRKLRGLSRGNKKQQNERTITELRDSYIRTRITSQSGLSYKDVPQDLVIEKRKQLRALRLYRRARKELTL